MTGSANTLIMKRMLYLADVEPDKRVKNGTEVKVKISKGKQKLKYRMLSVLIILRHSQC